MSSPEMTKYVPVIRWKAGEQGALKVIVPKKKKKFTPLIEVPPILMNHVTGSPGVTIDKHLAKIGSTLEQSWGTQALAFLDLLHVDPAERMADGRHPLAFALDEARLRSVPVVPVTGLGRDLAYQSAVRAAITKDKRGVCVRITPSGDGLGLGPELLRLVAHLGLPPGAVDLVLDVGTVDAELFLEMKRSVPKFVEAVPIATAWRSMVLIGGAFPRNLTGIPRGVQHLPRSEWALWKSLQRHSPPRLPIYGDYGIASPVLADIDPRTMNATASIRYTLAGEYKVVKGAGTRTQGYGQFVEQARTLVEEPDYRGASFSVGDELINSVATGESGSGNLTTWRKIGTNQHIEFVLSQV